MFYKETSPNSTLGVLSNSKVLCTVDNFAILTIHPDFLPHVRPEAISVLFLQTMGNFKYLEKFDFLSKNEN